MTIALFQRASGRVPRLLCGMLLCALTASAEAGDNLLENPGFEAAGLLGPWKATAGGESKWAPFEPEKSPEAKEGKASLRIPAPPEGDLAIVHQPIPAKALAHETTMHFTMWGRSDAALQLQAVISFNTPEGQRKVRVMHPGNGEWALMETLFDIPRTADLESFNVEIIVRPGSGPVDVDEAQFWHEEIAPQYDLPENADA